MAAKTADQHRPTDLLDQDLERVQGGVIAYPQDPGCIGCVKDDSPKRASNAVNSYQKTAETISN